MRRFAPQLFAHIFFIGLMVFCVSTVQAQVPSRPTTQQQVQNREWALENLRKQARLQPTARQRLLDQAALRNDFRQLQVVNNNLMARMFGSASTQKISNKEIRSSLGDIKKIAERLAEGFGLPAEKSQTTTEVALTPGLLQLDKAVMSFVDNELFQEPRIYDAELASQAAKDLSDVLRLTDVLRKLTKEN